MVEVSVCVGSSCHMRGSYQVIKTFNELIKRGHLEEEIKIKASFCMGRCMNGICLLVDDQPVENVGFSNAEQVFYQIILPLARGDQPGGQPGQRPEETGQRPEESRA